MTQTSVMNGKQRKVSPRQIQGKCKWLELRQVQDFVVECAHTYVANLCGMYGISFLRSKNNFRCKTCRQWGNRSSRHIVLFDGCHVAMLTQLVSYLLYGAESFLRSYPVFSQSRNSPHFMEPEGSLPHSLVPATYPYPEPTRSSPCAHKSLHEDPS